MKKIITLLLFLIVSVLSYSQPNLDELKNKNINIYKFVTSWIGVKYKFGGTTRSGIDCSAFTKKLYEKVYNIVIPRTASLQYKAVSKVKKDSLETGDLVFFRTNTMTTWHVGIYLIDGYFVHSGNKKTGVRINSLSESYYTRAYLSGGRI